MRHRVALGMRRSVFPFPEGYPARSGVVLAGGAFSRELTRRMAVLWWGR